MPTIKLTGLSGGLTTTVGTTDDALIDGSLTIGDDATDSIIVNAEFDSDLVPDDSATYDLGSSTKLWDKVYATQLVYVNNTANSLAIGFPDPTGTNTLTVPDTTGTLAVEAQLPSFFLYGRNGALNSTNTTELRTLNGSDNGQGYRLPVPATVTDFSVQMNVDALSTTGNQLTYEVYKNGIATGSTLVLTPSATGDLGGAAIVSPPLDCELGDTITVFCTVTATGTGNLSISNQACVVRVLN